MTSATATLPPPQHLSPPAVVVPSVGTRMDVVATKFAEYLRLNDVRAASKAPVNDVSDTIRTSFFLVGVYGLSRRSQEEQAIDAVFDYVDDSLNRRAFSLVNDIFFAADPNKLLPSVIHSLLMVSHAAKDRLPFRASFLSRAVAVVGAAHGAEEAHDLLRYE